MIDKQPIKRVSQVKYLGIILDQHLWWDVKVNAKAKILKYRVFELAKLRNVMSQQNLLSIMYGIYYSIATYGIITWGSAIAASNKKLFSRMPMLLLL